MKNSKINFIIMLAFLMAGVFSNSVFAQDAKQEKQANPGMCKEGKAMGFIKDLTPEQQKQIDALKLNLTKECINIQNLIGEKQAHIKTITSGDNVDLAAVNKTYDELFALKADVAKKHAAFQQDVRKLLTADQKVQFDIHQAKMKQQGSCSEKDGQHKCQGSGQGCSHEGMGAGCCKGHSDAGCCKQKASCKGHGEMEGQGKNCPKK